MELYVKLNVQEALLGECFRLYQDIGFIPLLESSKFLLWRHTRISQHLQLLYEHLGFKVHIIMNSDLTRTKCKITNMEMFAKCKVVVFAQLFHSPLHSLLKSHNGLLTTIKNLFVIKLHSHIHNFKYLVLEEGQLMRKLMKNKRNKEI